MQKVNITALALAASLLAATVAVHAEEGDGPRRERPHRRPPPGQFLERMEKNLDLTDAQKEQIKPILEEARQKHEALKADTTLSREEKMEKAREIHKDVHDQLKNILTPEQQEKLREHREQRRERRQDRAEKHHRRGPEPTPEE